MPKGYLAVVSFAYGVDGILMGPCCGLLLSEGRQNASVTADIEIFTSYCAWRCLSWISDLTKLHRNVRFRLY